MINVEKKGRRIEVRSRSYVPSLKKVIPGAYLTAGGYWTVPLSWESCLLLRQKFGKNLKIGSELERWAVGVKQSRQYMGGLAGSMDASLELLPDAAPTLSAAMEARTYQRVGARFIADAPAALIASDPGLGKTLIAMGGLLEADVEGPYLVVCPKIAAESVWRREIMRWLPRDHRVITMPQLGSQRAKRLATARYGPKTWVVVNPEMLQTTAHWQCRHRLGQKKICGRITQQKSKQQRKLACGHIKRSRQKITVTHKYLRLFEITWGAVINDESHETLLVRSGKITQRRRGMVMLKVRPDGRKLALSGTPFDHKPELLWGTLNWLAPQTYSAQHRWIALFWNQGGFSGYEVGDFIAEREPMLWDSLSSIVLRQTKEECAPDLPPKTYVGTPYDPDEENSPLGIWLEMDGEQARAYEDMERTSIADLESGRLEALSALTELTRLKQMACAYGDMRYYTKRVACDRSESPCYGYRECLYGGWHEEDAIKYVPKLPSNKFNWTVEALEEWGYPDKPIDKVVVVSFYTSILGMFQRGIESHFKTKADRPLCTSITGRTPAKERARIIDRFNTDDSPHVLMLNVKAGGTAITLDSADRTIFISETRIPTQQMQAEDRTHRVSNPRPTWYYYLRSLGTVDVGTAYMNSEGTDTYRRLLDTRRGVDYFQTVMDLSR